MHKDPANDKVIVDREKCVGCWTCILVCPYGALSRDMNNKTVIKCDLCPGQEIPACVINCPNEALVLGIDEKKE
jgi:carbon-monoxide dehydrogenase iron sulfur subunit